jgi:hypothetical protein
VAMNSNTTQGHVSMLHIPFGPWQRIRVNSQRDV